MHRKNNVTRPVMPTEMHRINDITCPPMSCTGDVLWHYRPLSTVTSTDTTDLCHRWRMALMSLLTDGTAEDCWYMAPMSLMMDGTAVTTDDCHHRWLWPLSSHLLKSNQNLNRFSQIEVADLQSHGQGLHEQPPDLINTQTLQTWHCHLRQELLKFPESVTPAFC